MSNDATRHEFADVLALVQEQMADLEVLQKKRAVLTATGEAADGTIEVTVNAQGAVIRTVIDEAYLEDFEFEDLGEYVTEAARAATQEVGRRSAELLVPLTERRKAFPSLSDVVDGAPDLRTLMSEAHLLGPEPKERAGSAEDDWDEPTAYPTVKG